MAIKFNRKDDLQILREDIERTCKLFMPEGSILEVRVLRGKAGVISGYFDDPRPVPDAVARWSGKAQGVYFTINPVAPELLGRSPNRLTTGASNTTSDSDVMKRRWLFVDFDPVKPSGVSSTEEEHEAAIARARQVRDQLLERGWPSPILADSGNGAHLLYPVDLPNDEKSGTLLKGCLDALSLFFGDEIVEVDQRTSNPSRICKLYGTLTMKGENSDERPHRMSRLLEVPDSLSIVRRDQLEALSWKKPSSSERYSTSENLSGDFDLDQFIAKHLAQAVTKTGSWQDGRKWVLNPCPFNPEHTNHAAYIVQFGNRAIGAGCHHNGCTDKGWRQLREMFEPGSYSGEAGEQKPSQSEQLLGAVLSDRHDLELFTTPRSEPYASFSVDGHRETWPIDCSVFERFLKREFYNATGKAINQQALSGVVDILKAKADFEGETREVYVRVAGKDDKIYLDLCDEQWRCVEITPEGWTVIDQSPLRFRRSPWALPLPVPEKGGSLDELRELINASDDRVWTLALSWLVGALRPSGPHAILAIHGEQGSAKSTMARTLRNVIDPVEAPIRAASRSEQELLISANNSWVIALDNLSGIDSRMADALCRLATGAGISTRTLYTDLEETVISVSRPIELNGIEEFLTRADLSDRSLVIHLPRISGNTRKLASQLDDDFQEAHGRILGALLDAVVVALRNRDKVTLVNLPRMADFATWVRAAEPALPWPDGTFERTYQESRAELSRLALEESPIGMALREFLRSRSEYEGTPSDLLEKLRERTPPEIRKKRGFPENAAWLSRRLSRILPALRDQGVHVECSRGKERLIRITVEKFSVDPVDGVDQAYEATIPRGGYHHINPSDYKSEAPW